MLDPRLASIASAPASEAMRSSVSGRMICELMAYLFGRAKRPLERPCRRKFTATHSLPVSVEVLRNIT
jgi:hypothetical protein